MKKIFVMLVALIGFGINANAQMCQFTQGVEPTIGVYSEKITIDLVNTNDYKVTVDVIVEIVLTSGTTKTIKRTLVIDKYVEIGTSNKKSIKTTIKHTDADIDASSVKLIVSKCN